MTKRKTAAVLVSVVGIGMMLGGYYLTTLWFPTAYSTGVTESYDHWRLIPAGGALGPSIAPTLTCSPSCSYEASTQAETAKVTFVSAANGTLALKITDYPQGKTLLTLVAPQYETALEGSGGPGISYAGGNTTVYADFVLPEGTTYLNLSIVNNGTRPVNSTYASWSPSYPVYSHVYVTYGWAALLGGTFVAVAGTAIQLLKTNRRSDLESNPQQIDPRPVDCVPGRLGWSTRTNSPKAGYTCQLPCSCCPTGFLTRKTHSRPTCWTGNVFSA